ncbi:MAG: tetratricopeptide repeat protein [Bryobacteraceae bacterium]|nr:tetratricopeptide repeat protein [Bryobacteraceae bacterium]
MLTRRVFSGTLFLCVSAFAQVHLRGTVETQRSAQDLLVEMRPAGASAMDSVTVMPGLNGQFDFHGLKQGHYTLAVKTHRGDALKEERVFLSAGEAEITVRLKDEAKPEGRGTVDARSLHHVVPKAARKAMGRYAKCRAAHDEAGAEHALDEALAADPELLEAWVNRSALYARTRSWTKALADVDQALRLDPRCTLALTNRAFVSVHLRDYPTALRAARAALRSDPANLSAQYLQALAQFNLGDRANALGQLKKLAPEYEPARLTLAATAP